MVLVGNQSVNICLVGWAVAAGCFWLVTKTRGHTHSNNQFINERILRLGARLLQPTSSLDLSVRSFGPSAYPSFLLGIFCVPYDT